MSHSIEELKRQLEQAISRKKQADTEVLNRRKEYDDALCADKLTEFLLAGG